MKIKNPTVHDVSQACLNWEHNFIIQPSTLEDRILIEKKLKSRCTYCGCSQVSLIVLSLIAAYIAFVQLFLGSVGAPALWVHFTVFIIIIGIATICKIFLISRVHRKILVGCGTYYHIKGESNIKEQ